jgi:hypothetical protein
VRSSWVSQYPFLVALMVGRRLKLLLSCLRIAGDGAPCVADVTLGTLRAPDAREYAGLPIDGRLTLTAVKSGSPLRVADLSPVMTSAFPGGFVVVGLDVSRAGVLGGALSVGDPVQLLLARQGVRTGEMKAVVLSVSRENTQEFHQSLVIAVGTEDVQRFGPALASGGDVVIIRDPHQR